MIFLGIVLLGAVVYIVVSDWLFMKKDLTKIDRLKMYKETILMQWSILLLVCIAWLIGDFEWHQLFTIDSIESDNMIEYSSSFIVGVVVGLSLLIVIWTWRVKNGSKHKPVIENVSFFLPQTKRERMTFIFIAATAGICEEIIFRGAMAVFLLSLPFDWSLNTVAIISAIIFGVVHYYQGVKGMLATGLFGFVAFNIYVSSGSLLLPILIHFVIDLKFVFTPNGQLEDSGDMRGIKQYKF